MSPVLQQDRICSTLPFPPEMLRCCCAGRRFGVLYAAVGLIVIFQLVTAVVQQTHGLSHGQSLGVMVGMLVLLSTVLLAPFGSGGVVSKPAHQDGDYAEGFTQEQPSTRYVCQAQAAWQSFQCDTDRPASGRKACSISRCRCVLVLLRCCAKSLIIGPA